MTKHEGTGWDRTRTDCSDDACTVATWVARITRVHAQDVEHVPEVETHSTHSQLHAGIALSCIPHVQAVTIGYTQ